MKKIVKLLSVVCILGCFSGLYAENKVPYPKNNEVVVVLRVDAVTDQDINWFAEARDLPAEQLNHVDRYCMPYTDPVDAVGFADASSVSNFEKYSWAKSGEYVFVKYFTGKSRQIIFKRPISYFFRSHYMLSVELPMGFMITIPEDEKYVYLGDFNYVLEGFNFNVKNVKVRDNYEDAKKALIAAYGTEINLARVELQEPPKQNTIEFFSFDGGITTNFNKWFKNFED